MSDKKRKRQEYKRKWIANVRKATKKTFDEEYSSSGDELHNAQSSSTSIPCTLKESSGLELYSNSSISTPSLPHIPVQSTSQTEELELTEQAFSGDSDSDNDWDAIDRYNDVLATSSSESDDGNETLKTDLSTWVCQFQIHHSAADALLKVLRSHGNNSLPQTARTLLNTMKEVETQNISGMEYYNFGFRNELIENMKTYTNYILDALETVDISLNIDGLPLFKSTHTSLWPVLCQIHLKPKKVFPVVLTIGSSKPDNLNFLNPTIEELNDLLQNGFQVDDKLIHVNLKCIVCDAPARAMVKGIKLYSGYYGCDRCNQKGVYLGRITYQDVENLTLRTDTSFRNQEQIQHHNTNSPFCNLPIDMVNQFPIDYMHQACLGVTKRLLLIWIKKGARRLKLSVQQRNEISLKLVSIGKFIPRYFARKPRGLDVLERWKATEFRQFLVYTGKYVLKNILADNLYSHFMSLSVAISILICPRLVREHIQYVKDLLKYFVMEGRILYGEEFLIYNVHSMLHIADDAERFQSLDGCGAFEFENHLQKIKKMVRSGKRPLVQVVKRIKEIQECSSIDSEQVPEHKLVFNAPNNVYLLDRNRFCQLISSTNIVDDDGKQMIMCRVYTRHYTFFDTPCDSRIIGCYKFDNRYTTMESISQSKFDRPAIMIETGNNTLLVMAILHEF